MRYVIVPAPAKFMVPGPDGKPVEATLTLVQLIVDGWTNSKSFLTNFSEIERAGRIRKAFRDASSEGANIVILDEEDWKVLSNIVQNETSLLNPSLIPYIYDNCPEMFRCILNASSENPNTQKR